MKKKKTIEQELKRDKIMLLITSIMIVILIILLIISRNYRDFSIVNIKENDKTIFSISDLVVNDLKYGDSEKVVKEKLGTPKKENSLVKDKYMYKELSYDGLKLTLKENYTDYILTKVEITNKKYAISRDIKVNDGIIKTMKKFRVENKSGTYLYGNYSSDTLNESEIKDTIYFGMRDNSEITYVNKDAAVDDVISNISRLTIKYKRGKITKITWSYDFE